MDVTLGDVYSMLFASLVVGGIETDKLATDTS